MFDVGLTEIIVIMVVSTIVFDVKDLAQIIKFFKQITVYINHTLYEIKQITNEIEKESSKIIDLDGNEQITYNLEDIMPDIKKDEQQNKN